MNGPVCITNNWSNFAVLKCEEWKQACNCRRFEVFGNWMKLTLVFRIVGRWIEKLWQELKFSKHLLCEESPQRGN
jgi:hypothetical protein